MSSWPWYIRLNIINHSRTQTFELERKEENGTFEFAWNRKSEGGARPKCWSGFVSRVVALGFTPGTEVVMLNFSADSPRLIFKPHNDVPDKTLKDQNNMLIKQTDERNAFKNN